MEHTLFDKTQALPKGMNKDMWVISTLSQIFKRGFLTLFFK